MTQRIRNRLPFPSFQELPANMLFRSGTKVYCANCSQNLVFRIRGQSSWCLPCMQAWKPEFSCAKVTNLYSYDANPMAWYPPYMGEKPTTLPFLGVELEVHSPKRCAENSEEHYPPCPTGVVFKSDGSICPDGDYSCGMEIVTVPMTLRMHRQFWYNWATSPDYPRKHGFKGWSEKTCGMHVHLSRVTYEVESQKIITGRTRFGEFNAGHESGTTHQVTTRNFLTPTEEQQLMWLCANPQFEPFWEFIAGRGFGRYNESLTSSRKCYVSEPGEYSHYHALNGNERTGTLEFRMFQSNLKYGGIMRNLELVMAMWHFVQDNGWPRINPDQLTKYIIANAPDYKFLYCYLIRKGRSRQMPGPTSTPADWDAYKPKRVKK